MTKNESLSKLEMLLAIPLGLLFIAFLEIAIPILGYYLVGLFLLALIK